MDSVLQSGVPWTTVNSKEVFTVRAQTQGSFGNLPPDLSVSIAVVLGIV